MWSREIVVDPPVFDDLPRNAVAGKQMLVETFVPQPADEALYQTVLHRFAWGDVVPFNTPVLLPLSLTTMQG